MKFKNAISPVIAIALLLVVSVVAVVGYQSWYAGYQSILTSDVEQKSTSSGSINIEYISSDGTLYVTNSGNSNLTMGSLEVSGSKCTITDDLVPGVNKVDISSCLNNTGTNDIVIVTDSGIIEESLFVEDLELSQSCNLDGQNIPNQENGTFYNSSSVPYGNSCSFLVRVCNEGSLNGDLSYNISSCVIDNYVNPEPLITSGLLNYWPLRYDGEDKSASSINLSLIGDQTSPFKVVGGQNCAEFNGVNYLITDSLPSWIASTNSGSVSFWFYGKLNSKTPTWGLSGYRSDLYFYIGGKIGYTPNSPTSLFHGSWVSTGSAVWNYISNMGSEGEFYLLDDNWHHVYTQWGQGITDLTYYDGVFSQNWGYFRGNDGNPYFFNSVNYGSNFNPTGISFGGRNLTEASLPSAGGGPYWNNVVLRDVYIFNRVLTPAEITTLASDS